jgi:hypothetical protein
MFVMNEREDGGDYFLTFPNNDLILDFLGGKAGKKAFTCFHCVRKIYLLVFFANQTTTQFSHDRENLILNATKFSHLSSLF